MTPLYKVQKQNLMNKWKIKQIWKSAAQHRNFFLRFYLFTFRDGKGARERGRDASMCGCVSRAPQLDTQPTIQAPALTGNRTRCPDWESNQGPFGLQVSAQSTELHQPGWNLSLLFTNALSSPLSLKGGAGRELSTPLFQKQTSLAPPALDWQISENSLINFQTHFSQFWSHRARG